MRTHDGISRLAWWAPALAALLLSGCAGVSPDGGLAPVRQLTGPHLRQDVQLNHTPASQAAVQARVAELLAGPLSMDDAVQVALFNNRGLQAALADVGVAEAELVAVSRLPNPAFSFARL